MKQARAGLCSMLLALSATAADPTVSPAPNGITIPAGYKDWRLIGVSQRTENETLRAILGNDIAIRAAREGKTNPWPEGTILAKLVWKQKKHERFATANVPDSFVHAEFMEKNSKQYGSTGGWGFARWLGAEKKPYGQDANFAQECFICHGAARNTDWVFTAPAPLP